MQEAGPGTVRGGRDEVRLSSVAHPGTIPHLAHATPPLFLDAFLGKDNVSILSRATRKKLSDAPQLSFCSTAAPAFLFLPACLRREQGKAAAGSPVDGLLMASIRLDSRFFALLPQQSKFVVAPRQMFPSWRA